jgi:DNA-binding beta-propeller fold protein YncE
MVMSTIAVLGLHEASPAGEAGIPPTAYVVNPGSDNLTPIDTVTTTPGTPITAGSAPIAIAIAPDGKTAYVVNVDVWITGTSNEGGGASLVASEVLAVWLDGLEADIADPGDGARQ